MKKTIIAIDAMGGDIGPAVTIKGLVRTKLERPNTSFLVFGDSDKITAELNRHKDLQDICTVVHCEKEVAMEAKPSVALRQGRKVSGMWRAIDAVKQGEAH